MSVKYLITLDLSLQQPRAGLLVQWSLGVNPMLVVSRKDGVLRDEEEEIVLYTTLKEEKGELSLGPHG